MSEVSAIQAKINEVDAKLSELSSASSQLGGVSINISPDMEGISGLHVAGTKYDKQKENEINNITEGRDELIQYRDRAKSAVDEEISYLNTMRSNLETDLANAKAAEAAREAVARERARARSRKK